jgi:septal ring factor EnvC (AmiA/AmiB activator)
MDTELKEIHIGKAIEERINQLGITKTEFAARVEIPQQHVYRVFQRDTIEIKKLIKICKVLDFNFFALFCGERQNFTAFLSALNTGTNGNATNILAPEAAAAELLIAQTHYKQSQEQLAMSNILSAQLQSQMKDKDSIIAMKDEQIAMKNELLATKNEQIEMLKAEVAQLKAELAQHS